MKEEKIIFLGDQLMQGHDVVVKGEEVKIDAESYYKISNYDAMRPFFMSIVSNSNHWMFLSSTGGLSAGRKTANSHCFPTTRTIRLQRAQNLPLKNDLFS